ncbi:MAG: adenosylcobalamin-dependent ribonucleoside-diphosphate reductase [Bacteroidetes bacterium]|nr:adenosylcobalamin-dependent ribonucleoside-diphosphate reductase [Bacteroidota bacterium]HET6244166.1 adenosylcobalamin-dependent ribonucleoside-diphosphate reductase [Bacteroidia bacterium]
MTTAKISKKTLEKVYSYKEVLEKSIAYFDGDELAASTWINKYCMKDKEGNYLELTPEDMHRRMAREFARKESEYRDKINLNGSAKLLSAYGQKREFLSEEKIHSLFKDFSHVIPQGSVMSTLGNPYIIASLSNCVVLPEIYDSYGGIFFTDQQMAQLFKRRCGVGIDISTLRPAGFSVSNAAETTTGAVSFMERFSNTTREVAQNGRRGALMITIDIAHPDVEKFIAIKQDLSKVTGANISIRLSDEFMSAVANNTDYTLRWPIDSANPEVKRSVKAQELWNTIIQCAHNTAEPGLIFWDRQHWYSTSSVYPGYKNVSTNPCSEIAMQGGDSCRLIALNLYGFVEDPFTTKAKFNYKKFYEVTYETQRLMDDLVDLELEAIDRIMDKIKSDKEPDYIKDSEIKTWELLYNAGKKGRRTGLGFTALGDSMAALGFKFDSPDALAEIEKIMKTKCEAEFESSIDMAIERGAFVGFDPEIEKTSEFIHMMEKELPNTNTRMMKHGRRNISISTVAPTGTLSMLAQSSSGLEPLFMLSYTRRRKINPSDPNSRVDFVDQMGDSWQEFVVYHSKLKQWMDITGEKDINKSPYFGSTAPEIDWIKRVEIQSVVQKYVTHSISSTINLPQDVSVEKVGQIYMEAWKHGLKGITVYRDGSRSGVLISNDEKKKDTIADIVETQAPKRPKVIEAEIIRFTNDYEKWIAVVGLINGRPYEIFTGKAEDAFVIPYWLENGWIIKNKNEKGITRYDFQYKDKEGYKVTIEGLSRSFNEEFWNYAKLISGVLRHGMPLPQVVELISNLNLYSDNINTWKVGVERALKKFIPDGTKAPGHKCPSCNDPDGLIYEEGCLKCKSCGHSKCG